MGQQLVNGDRARHLAVGVVGKVGGDGVVEGQLPVFRELQDRDGREHLVHRAEVELRVHPVRAVRLAVRQAGRGLPGDLVVAGDEHHPRELVPGDEVFHEGGEAVEAGARGRGRGGGRGRSRGGDAVTMGEAVPMPGAAGDTSVAGMAVVEGGVGGVVVLVEGAGAEQATASSPTATIETRTGGRSFMTFPLLRSPRAPWAPPHHAPGRPRNACRLACTADPAGATQPDPTVPPPRGLGRWPASCPGEPSAPSGARPGGLRGTVDVAWDVRTTIATTGACADLSLSQESGLPSAQWRQADAAYRASAATKGTR